MSMPPDSRASRPVPEETAYSASWDKVRALIKGKEVASPEVQALHNQSQLLISLGTMGLHGGTRRDIGDLQAVKVEASHAVLMYVHYRDLIEEGKRETASAATHQAFEDVVDGLIMEEERADVGEDDPQKRRAKARILVGEKLNDLAFGIEE